VERGSSNFFFTEVNTLKQRGKKVLKAFHKSRNI